MRFSLSVITAHAEHCAKTAKRLRAEGRVETAEFYKGTVSGIHTALANLGEDEAREAVARIWNQYIARKGNEQGR